MAEGGSNKIEELSEKQHGRITERNCTLYWQGIDTENLRKLKQARGCKKGVVTKAQQEIELKDQANVSLLTEKLEQLKKVFKEFVSAHAAYRDILEDACDIDKSNEYFRAIKQNNKRLASEISCWGGSKETDFDLPADTNLREVVDDVSPSDSISKVSSRAVSKHSRGSKSRSTCSKELVSNSVLSRRAKAAARRAIL